MMVVRWARARKGQRASRLLLFGRLQSAECTVPIQVIVPAAPEETLGRTIRKMDVLHSARRVRVVSERKDLHWGPAMPFLTILGIIGLGAGFTPTAALRPGPASCVFQQPALQFVGASGPDKSTIHMDLGDVDPVVQPTLTQEFRLRNTSSSSVRITKL